MVPTAETLKRHGITEAEYLALLEAQGGVCGVCGKPPTKRPLVIDHSHRIARTRGRRLSVRGLVHSMCNRRLGQIQDSAALALGMYEYLRCPPAWSVLDSSELR